MLTKSLQPSNVDIPILVRVFGSVTLVKLIHLPNALSPIVVTPSGIVMLTKSLHQ